MRITVAEESPKTPDPFDVQTIKELVRMMSRNEISEVDLRRGDQRIRLLRGNNAIIPVPAPTEYAVPQVQSIEQQASSETAPAAPAKPLFEIKSPTPGTYYAAPSHDAEHFVKVGSPVTPDTVVCLIEAMKLFTDVTAEVNGVVAEILVQNQQPVEYGTVLFRVDTSG